MGFYGLLGEKLTHSYSPQIHKMLGSYEYLLFEKNPDELADFFNNSGFSGINVTIPYKKTAAGFCSELSPTAKRLGNVNTVIRRTDGSLFGHNTDYYGFSCMVRRSGIGISDKKILVLGSGGASATVCAVLKDLNAKDVTVISRSGKDNYDNISVHYNADIIVNATPVGMYPNTGCSPVTLGNFQNCSGVFDLIYNPSKTALLLSAERLGIPHVNGLSMLVAQAKESAELFTASAIDEAVIDSITGKLSADMKNIILIGMPGCGKSSVGKIIAQKLGREFIDADSYVAEKSGMTIPEIFKVFGENGFRSRETEALSEICRKSSCVIATGGGAVTRPENYCHMHQNGTIVWIKRDINSLPADGRPLSAGADLFAMFEKREPLYESFSDLAVENNTSEEDAAQKIMESIL